MSGNYSFVILQYLPFKNLVTALSNSLCKKGLHRSDVTKCHSASVQYLGRTLVSSQRNSRHSAAMPSLTINVITTRTDGYNSRDRRHDMQTWKKG